ncbi:MAG: M23 family metallopeptidase [Thermodesulfobacteriota bacterium]
MAKRYTILVVPQDHTEVKRFSASIFLLKAAVIVFTVSTLVFSWLVYDYIKIRSERVTLYKLKEENKEQKIRIQSFANKVNELELQMVKLDQFDRKLRIITNLNPPSESSKLLGVGGPSPDDSLILWNSEYDSDLLSERLNLRIEELEQGTYKKEESFNELHEYLLGQEALLASTPSIWPTKGWLSSDFGYRISPFTSLRQKHEGLDIANRLGTPIIAPSDGMVIKVGRGWALGKYIVINHGYGIKTKYGHLSKILVKRGEQVKRGDKIAVMGSTGRSTGPHLHYEVLVNNVQVDPRKYILN